MLSKIGIGFNIGGGFGGFTGTTMRDTVTDTNAGGLWSARATIGTHIPIGLDISYIGTAVDLAPIVGVQPGGTLIGTDVEGAVRWNILPHYMWNPYVFLGAGWQNYEVTDANVLAMSRLQDSDNLAVFPMGAGVAYRDPTGITFDLRGTYRAAENSDLFLKPNGEFASLDTWEASGSLGYEF